MKNFILTLLIIITLFVFPSENGNVEIIENTIETSSPKTNSTFQSEDVIIPAELDLESKKVLDFTTLNPSYNLLVSNALLEENNTKELYINKDNNEDWSLSFLSWCITKTNANQKTTYIPCLLTNDIQEIISFFNENNRYYIGPSGCRPITGDFIIYDMNNDKTPDRIGLVVSYDSITSELITIGADDSKVVLEKKNLFNSNVFGFCRPNYNIVRQDHANLPLNAVDTVVPIRREQDVENLAKNGVKVIARYINPEGRAPLSLEEVKMFSKYNIGTMMIYQINQDDPYKGYEKGYEFGLKALEYARNLQAPKGTPIFFCCDCTAYLDSFYKVGEFINGVNDAMQGEYSVGLYGGFYVNEAMYNIEYIDAYWQAWGLSDKYLSNNYDMIQWSGTCYPFKEIPIVFDANYVKNPEKVSFIFLE